METVSRLYVLLWSLSADSSARKRQCEMWSWSQVIIFLNASPVSRNEAEGAVNTCDNTLTVI